MFLEENTVSKIKITVDSTCDLGDVLMERYNIDYSPLYVTLGEKSLKDTLEVTPDDIYKFVDENKILPKTSAGTIEDYTKFFSKFVNEGYEVIHICISSDMSCTFQNACIAAEEIGNCYVIDSKNLSTGSGHLALLGAELADEGKSAKEIYDILNETVPRVRASFIVSVMDYLKMGGRCSAIAAFGANVLKIMPCIEVDDGKMHPAKKYRGALSAVLKSYTKDKLSDLQSIDPNRIFITHSGCDEKIVNEIYNQVKELNYFKNIEITRAGCVITSHCGPGTLGVLFIKK